MLKVQSGCSTGYSTTSYYWMFLKPGLKGRSYIRQQLQQRLRPHKDRGLLRLNPCIITSVFASPQEEGDSQSWDVVSRNMEQLRKGHQLVASIGLNN